MLWKTKGEVKEGGGVVKFGGGTATALKVDLTAPTRELGGVVNYFLDKIFLSLRRRRSFSHFYNPAHAKLFSAAWAICYIFLAGRSASACVLFHSDPDFFSAVQVHSLALLGAGEPKQTRARKRERERRNGLRLLEIDSDYYLPKCSGATLKVRIRRPHLRLPGKKDPLPLPPVCTHIRAGSPPPRPPSSVVNFLFCCTCEIEMFPLPPSSSDIIIDAAPPPLLKAFWVPRYCSKHAPAASLTNPEHLSKLGVPHLFLRLFTR